MLFPVLGYARKRHPNTCQFIQRYFLYSNLDDHAASIISTPICLFFKATLSPPRLVQIRRESISFLAGTSVFRAIVPFPPYHAIRVGEAKNPGPEDLAAFNLAIVNPTAIRTKFQDMNNLRNQYNLHAIACAETSATRQIQNDMTAKFRQMKFRSFWSSPVDPQRMKLNQEPSLRGKSEGTSLHTSM